jgi:hypothetical protein
MTDLFMAIYHEHMARTRHDVFKMGPLSTIPITCDVCLYLSKIKRDFEKAEQKYYDEQTTS